MKTKTLLATMFAAVFCAQMAAQPFQRESFPASQSFFGCSRWSSAIEIKEVGCDDFEVQDVAQVAA
jgi:hypothetical protein